MANESINLDLSLDEVNIVLNALGELPAKSSMGVISRFNHRPNLKLHQACTRGGGVSLLFYEFASTAYKYLVKKSNMFLQP